MVKRKLHSGFPENFSVAIVEPEYAINLGYLGRTMANFGVRQLIVVNRKLRGAELNEAEKFASHGMNVIKDLRYVRSVKVLKERFEIIIGTTAIQGKRKSNITRKTLELGICAEKIFRILSIQGSYRVCLLLGRDTTGLTNEELRDCDFTASIRTGSDYNTLNVSHAAAIMFYAFKQRSKQYKRGKRPTENSTQDRNARREKELVVGAFKELALNAEYQKFKRDKLIETVSRILSRSDPSIRELYLLLGVISRATSKIKRLSR